MVTLVASACGDDSGASSGGGTGATTGAAATGSTSGSTTSTSSNAPCTANTDTDPENCGACSHSCLGGACEAGTCQSVVLWAPGDPNATVRSLAVDAANVYVAGATVGEPPIGDVFSLDKRGGAPVSLGMAWSVWNDANVRSSEERVYLYEDSGASPKVYDKETGVITEGAGTVGGDDVTDVHLDEPRAFFTAYNGFLYLSSSTNDAGRNFVARDTDDGGYSPTSNGSDYFFVHFKQPTQVQSLARFPKASVTLDESDIAWQPVFSEVEAGEDYFQFIVADEESLFAAKGRNQIQRIDLASGSVTELTSFARPPFPLGIAALAMDATRVYWLEHEANAVVVRSVAKDGGEVTTLAESAGLPGGPELITPGDIVVDDQAVYWSTNTPAQVLLRAH